MLSARAVLSLIVILPAPSLAQSVSWEHIWDQADAAVVYVDRASIAGSTDLRSISTRTVYRAPLPEGYIAERIRTEEFDCVGHRTRLRRVTILANDGRPPQVETWAPGESPWRDTEPDTLGARKSEIACTGAQ